MNFLKLLGFVLALAFAVPSFAITCPCKCKQNWTYRFISVTPADVGLSEDADSSELFDRAPQACSAYCKQTTGDGKSFVRACL